MPCHALGQPYYYALDSSYNLWEERDGYWYPVGGQGGYIWSALEQEVGPLTRLVRESMMEGNMSVPIDTIIYNHEKDFNCVAHSEGQLCCLDAEHRIGLQLRKRIEDLEAMRDRVLERKGRLAYPSNRTPTQKVVAETLDYILTEEASWMKIDTILKDN